MKNCLHGADASYTYHHQDGLVGSRIGDINCSRLTRYNRRAQILYDMRMPNRSQNAQLAQNRLAIVAQDPWLEPFHSHGDFLPLRVLNLIILHPYLNMGQVHIKDQ